MDCYIHLFPLFCSLRIHEGTRKHPKAYYFFRQLKLESWIISRS